MVRQIIWSANAKADRIEILKYWIGRNKSNSYSKKLNKLFKQAINLIARNPGIGHLTVQNLGEDCKRLSHHLPRH